MALNTRPRETLPGDEGDEAIAGLATFGYVFFLLNVLALVTVQNLDLDVYRELIREDALLEDLTAFYFLAAGILLFGAAWMQSMRTMRTPRALLLIGSVVMLFVAGEEVSWGQRIFDYATPDLVARKNRQGEFNVHNIKELGFSKLNLKAAVLWS